MNVRKVSEAENVGYYWDISLCVLAMPPVVTVLLSDVNVVCEVVFCDSDCEFVERQTLILPPENVKRVWL